MDFIHSREYLNEGDIVELNCDTQCNFTITTDSNFSAFKRGDSFHYYGGKFEYFPACITVPHSDNWNIVIDLGGGSANIRYGLRFIKKS